MFDPIGLRTTGFDRLELFYQAALQPLSLSVLDEYPGARLRPRRAAHVLDRRRFSRSKVNQARRIAHAPDYLKKQGDRTSLRQTGVVHKDSTTAPS